MPLYSKFTNGRVAVPLSALLVTGGAASLTRDGAGQYALGLTAAGTTYQIGIPVQALDPYRVLPGGIPPLPLVGVRLTGLQLWVAISGADASAHTLSVQQETVAPNSARGAPTAVGGPLSYVVDGQPAGGLPTATRANPYLCQVLLGTPIDFTQDGVSVMAEWTLGTGDTSGAAQILGVTALCQLGTYG